MYNDRGAKLNNGNRLRYATLPAPYVPFFKFNNNGCTIYKDQISFLQFSFLPSLFCSYFEKEESKVKTVSQTNRWFGECVSLKQILKKGFSMPCTYFV